jgi:hypothetical protein
VKLMQKGKFFHHNSSEVRSQSVLIDLDFGFSRSFECNGGMKSTLARLPGLDLDGPGAGPSVPEPLDEGNMNRLRAKYAPGAGGLNDWL